MSNEVGVNFALGNTFNGRYVIYPPTRIGTAAEALLDDSGSEKIALLLRLKNLVSLLRYDSFIDIFVAKDGSIEVIDAAAT